MWSGNGLALNAGTSRGAGGETAPAGWLHPPECWGYSFGTGTSTVCGCDSPLGKGSAELVSVASSGVAGAGGLTVS